MTGSSRPAPGESRTTIIVWEIDDPAKEGDARYWWDEREVSRLRELAPDIPDLSGKPRGQSLASLRRRADSDDVEIGVPDLLSGREARSVRLSLDHWSGADPERTYLIIAHERSPTEEERESARAKGIPWPPEVEAVRQEWLAALAAEDAERSAALRERLDAVFEEHGFWPGHRSPWNHERATEIQPGVFVQDERPERNRP